MRAILKLIRPHQYLKNAFVLIGPLFAHQWDVQTGLQVALVFLAFCTMASAVYVLNDLIDVESDRQHPRKCMRPIPAGDISVRGGAALFALLAITSVTLSYLSSVWTLVFTLSYLGLNILYSWRLKHVVILDVFIISAGFMLRILAGTIGLGITPSSWILLCGLMLTLFLGFSKRRSELLLVESLSGSRSLTRRVLDEYSPIMLEQFIAVTAACTILSYGLYTVSPQTIALHGTGNLIYTLPFVVYGIFRYLFLLHCRGSGSDTAKDLFTDVHLLLTCSGWFVTTYLVLS